jgi:hypothetical protein
LEWVSRTSSQLAQRVFLGRGKRMLSIITSAAIFWVDNLVLFDIMVS